MFPLVSLPTRSAHSGAGDRPWWVDFAVLFAVAAGICALLAVVQEWEKPLRPDVVINLSPWALPEYTLYSLTRGWLAYAFSLVFTVAYASWAYYDPRARRVLLPLLDILQSIPVLGFLPGFVLALVHIFPGSTVGLEMACVLMIFTGQAWNMAFAYYDSLNGIPEDYRALGRFYGFRWYHRFLRIELPFAAQPLLYNSMVSMAGGWFFLTVIEAFRLENQDFRLPGLGSYMSSAIEHNNVPAQIYAIVAMGAMIVAVDRIIWWPLVKWAARFKLDDFGAASPVTGPRWLSWLSDSFAGRAITGGVEKLVSRLLVPPKPPTVKDAVAPKGTAPLALAGYYGVMATVTVAVAYGSWRLFVLLGSLGGADWIEIGVATGASLFRVTAAVIVGTLWAVPAGIMIGLNPKLASRCQPFIQFAASFPAPMIYPWLLAIILWTGGTLQTGAVLLLLFGTQWYILFNVIGAASAIPNEILCSADIMQLRGWNRWRKLLLPAVFPGMVTGWITAAGGAWNATIVSEYVHAFGRVYQATGLGAYISMATDQGRPAKLAAAVFVMAALVTGINRLLWRPLQEMANQRFRFGN